MTCSLVSEAFLFIAVEGVSLVGDVRVHLMSEKSGYIVVYPSSDMS